MPYNPAIHDTSEGENISHFNAVRIRAIGQGELQIEMRSLDAVKTSQLVPLKLQDKNDRSMNRLCNFVTQRAQLGIKTTCINDYFKINRVILFAKILWSDYPGGN